MKKTIVALMLFGIAAPAMAQTADPAAPAPKPKKEKKICRQSSYTGSALGSFVCRTKDEWAKIDGNPDKDASRTIDAAPVQTSDGN